MGHHTVSLSNRLKVTKEARWQNRRRWRWRLHLTRWWLGSRSVTSPGSPALPTPCSPTLLSWPLVQLLLKQRSGARNRAPLSEAAGSLVQLRHILVALQAAGLVFEACPAFAPTMAEVLLEAVASFKSFYAEFSAEVRDRHGYMERYLDRGSVEDKELIAAFRTYYPVAADKTSATGVFFPGRDQCRAEAYAKGDKTSCGLCQKMYVSGDKYTDGELTLCCACSNLKILGFVVLDRKKSL